MPMACRMLEADESPLSPPRTAVIAWVSSSLVRSWISIAILQKKQVDARSRLADDAVADGEQREEGISSELVVPDRRILRPVDMHVGVRGAARANRNRCGQVQRLADGVGGGISVVPAAHRAHRLRVEFFAQVFDQHCSSPKVKVMLSWVLKF